MGLNNKLVYIEWEDSCGGSGLWTDIDKMELNDMPIQKSVGWVVCEDKKWIMIVPHIGTTPGSPTFAYTGQGQMAIPKSAIVKKKFISF